MITIRPVQPSDFDHWSKLYDGYAEFYKVPMNAEIQSSLWSWLMDENHEVQGLLALLDGVPCGFAHVRRMPSPLRGTDIGFLDDLFVSPTARGNNVGGALFDELKTLAAEKEWSKIRWITADDNYRARGLYDKLSKKTMWNTYDMET
ncbi:MAG: GNAT family N-acetyltransferase [Gammaproteobacteria bacterium]|nr:GNAT family N-acetyltransferase [Gammaproteobacteria bacterium]NKB65216.1 GNAT family N-acetyltransferase [Gammaproteobacteria bacterium]